MPFVSLLNLFIAFTAGFITFFAGCLVPIVPVYVSFLAGVSANTEKIKKYDYLINSMLFTLGFGVVFILLGAGFSAISQALALHRRSIEIFGGLVLILMGALMLDKLILPVKQFNFFKLIQNKKGTRVGAFLLGLFFAISWTPCIGPVLASILLWVSISTSFWPGLVLLISFTVGLSLPFLIIGLMFDSVFSRIKALQSKLTYLHKISALALIVFGALLLTDTFSYFSGYFLARVGTLAPIIEFTNL